MSIVLDFFGSTVLFIIPSVVLLYVLTGVQNGGCMCPSSISVFLIGDDSCAFILNPPHFASAAYSITKFIALTKINIGPFKHLPYLLPK